MNEADPYSYPSPYVVPEPNAWHPQGPPLAPPPPTRPRRGFFTGVGLVAAGAAVGVLATTGLQSSDTAGLGSVAAPTTQAPTTQAPTTQAPTTQAPTQLPVQVPGQTSASVASAAQQKGIVVINTVLGYASASAAGTGILLTSDGEIVTNNHVIDGATKITVTIASTGAKYTADVVGTDPSDDVAVIKLEDASGLQPANIDDTPTPAVGDGVTAVGNAGGTGTLTAATGTVTALEQSITASDETGADAERLTGLIEVDAGVVSGDSGGPLYDSDGQVIGIDTAAEQDRRGSGAGYAIPIDDALTIVARIDKGVETDTIHIGKRGLLGVSVADAANGVTVQNVVDGSAAADAGIVPGDVITSVNGTSITSAQGLQDAIAATPAGESAKISWTDAAGTRHTRTVTLGTGPAD